MSKSEQFETEWKVSDGYVGHGSHRTQISVDDLEEGMQECDIRQLFADSIQDDFEQTVSWSSDDEDGFVEWALERLQEREEDGE